MGLLNKLKSLLGSDGGQSRSSPGEPEVTVEHEPSAESEHAVKGTSGSEPAADSAEADADHTTPSTAETAGAESESEASTAPDEPEAATTEEMDADAGAEEPDAEESAEESTPATAPSPPTDEIKGIGPTYAGRLADAGIETVADLAAADAETVAEAAETSTSRAEDWIDRAGQAQDG